MAAIGKERFAEFLDGFRIVDEHSAHSHSSATRR